MCAKYSFNPHGETFRLPEPDDYGNEFERLAVLVSQQRSLGREIVMVMGLGFVGAVMAAVIADIGDEEGNPSKFASGLKRHLQYSHAQCREISQSSSGNGQWAVVTSLLRRL